MHANDEPDEIGAAFRSAYGLFAESVPIGVPEWPPRSRLELRRRSMATPWTAAFGAFVLTAAFGAGWALSARDADGPGDSFLPATGSTLPAVTSDETYPSPFAAALALAAEGANDLVDARVTRMVAIYADVSTVDLRVQVSADGYCEWFGVAGFVVDGRLEWSGGPAAACDD